MCVICDIENIYNAHNMKKDFEIYKLTNTVNNKIYIGLTTQGTENRFKLHCWKAGQGSDYPLHVAIREFGKESFRREILESVENPTIARERERYFVKIFNSQDKNVGYNTTAGGEYFEVTDEMRKAMSKAQKGRRHTESFKSVLQYTKDGEFIREYASMTDAEAITGVSRTSIGRTLSKKLKKPSKSNPFIWVYRKDYDKIPKFIHPKEIFTDLNYKPSMSKACLEASKKYRHTNGDFSKHAKSVTKYSITGEELETYSSISEAARQNNITPEAIRYHLRGLYDYTNPEVLKRMKFIWKLK